MPEIRARRLQLAVTLLVLLALPFVVFWPVRHFDFVNYDDPIYVTENAQLKEGLSTRGIKWAFTTVRASNWHPLTWLSHMLDMELFGETPGKHHLVNLGFHSINTLLLFLLLRRMTSDALPSAVVAAFFACHPMHVESVAWISERKDVLSTFFWLLTTGFYVGYAEERTRIGPGFRTLSSLRYWLALLCFAFGLLSKPMLVTLPFTLFLLDFWPLKRLASASPCQQWLSLLLEKLPFLLLSAVACVATFLAQAKGGAIASLGHIQVLQRLGNAMVAYGFYLLRMFWPQDLAVFYPHPGFWPITILILSGAVFLTLTGLAIYQIKRAPYLAMGWFWFLGTLVPVIGLVQVGDQAFADRYTYIPYIGLFAAIAWILKDCTVTAPTLRKGVLVVGLIALLACIIVAHHQVGYWQNSETLFRRAVAVTENNYVANNNLANTLCKQGKFEEAEGLYKKALAILPEYEDAHLNLGSLYLVRGDVDAAAGHFLLAARFKPNSAEGPYNLGTVLAMQKKHAQAVVEFERALALKPDHMKAHYNLGISLLKLDRGLEAERHFRRAIQIEPQFGLAYYNLSLALRAQGQFSEAEAVLQRAVQLSPDYTQAKTELGTLLIAANRFDEAIALYAATLQANTNNAEAHNNMGLALARQGKIEMAAEHFAAVVRLEPDNADAHYNLGNSYLDLGKVPDAITQFNETVRLNPQDRRAQEKLARLKGQMEAEKLFR